MGEQNVRIMGDKNQNNAFVKSLLNDIKALEYMLDNDWFESDNMHIGAEQEMVLVDVQTFKPRTNAMEIMEKMTGDKWLETELAKFNLEITLDPIPFGSDCFSQLHQQISTRLDKISDNARQFGTEIALTGILPTLRKHHLQMENLTPKERYFALMEAINKELKKSAYELKLNGIDELIIKHDSPLLEACNTSFQVHMQVRPQDFKQRYNIAQVLAAPVTAISANSPIVFGKRLWHESRIAMFQQAIDTRGATSHMRESSPRVSFGKDWINESILDIYKEDISRFRVLLSTDIDENSLEKIQQNITPKLKALQVHNGTVYRWNRPCYGISPNGKPHLRIENRVIPSGPTVLDEVANACFWLGTMEGLANQYSDIREQIGFEDVQDNMMKAAKFGIDSKFTWFGDQKIAATELIKDVLIPIARDGLKSRKVSDHDIDKYLGVIEERADKHMNGARWMLRSYTKLKSQTTDDDALSVITNYILEKQKSGLPVHLWEIPKIEELKEYLPVEMRVSEFMVTDLFTVQPNDIVEFVADLMDWQKIRYAPVEDKNGHLIGLVTSRGLLRHMVHNKAVKDESEFVYVKDIMIKDPKTIDPDQSIMDAMQLMRGEKLGCLPVIKNGELVGVITEAEFLKISHSLLDRIKIQRNNL